MIFNNTHKSLMHVFHKSTSHVANRFQIIFFFNRSTEFVFESKQLCGFTHPFSPPSKKRLLNPLIPEFPGVYLAMKKSHFITGCWPQNLLELIDHEMDPAIRASKDPVNSMTENGVQDLCPVRGKFVCKFLKLLFLNATSGEVSSSGFSSLWSQ